MTTQPDRFTCVDAFRRLDDFLDRALSADDERRLLAHLEVCEVCAREYRFEESFLRHLRDKVQRTAAGPNTELARRISAALRSAFAAENV